jgi:hypothetical protein
VNNPGEFKSAEVEMQGWYREEGGAAPLRVRLSIEDRSLCLRSLTGELVARWSLGRLENRGIPFWGRDWSIGDHELPMQTLTVENDEDYVAIQSGAPGLRLLRARAWRQLLFWPGAHGNLKAGPAFIWVMLAVALAFAGWRLWPF